MKYKKIVSFLFVLIALALPLSAYAAGTCTITEDWDIGLNYKEVRFVWLSDAATGDCSCNYVISGVLVGVDFLCTNTDEPTDDYDVVLYDYTGINDFLDGAGANISQLDANANQDTWYRSPLTVDGNYRVFMNQAVTLSVTNAGNSKTGIVVLKLLME